MSNGINIQNQQGQAIVYTLIFTVVILLSVLMLYNSGKLTSEKMKLQNAADATAYSISVLEARDLNFTAYTNRAMIGNEIAIAQLVGLYSWLDLWGSSLRFFDELVINRLQQIFVPVIGGSGGTFGPVAVGIIAALRVTSQTLQRGVDAVQRGISGIAPIASKVIAAINQAYSLAQRGMHYSTIVLSVSTLDEVIKANAPGAKLSDFGFFALGAHIGTYYANPKNPMSFVKHNKANADDDLGLFMRHQYAATINGSRDDFSVDRDGGFQAELLPFPEIDITVNLLIARATIFFDLGIDLLRRGGTDLRFKKDGGQEHYSWTGVDLIGLDFWIDLRVMVEFWLPIVGWFDAPFFPINLNPPFQFPLGVGAGQIASSQGVMEAGDMSGVEGDAYGGAPGDLSTAYYYPLLTPDFGVPRNMAQTNSLIFDGHRGLPAFNSVLPVEKRAELKAAHPTFEFAEDLGFMAPYLVIGLVKEQADIRTTDDILNSNASRKIHLDNDLQDSEMAGIAKSEVYFSRPTDPLASHFNRNDGRTEYGSTYNPFWQARLVDTTISERVIAMLFQQKQLWALDGVTFTIPVLGPFDLNAQLRKLGLI